LGCEEKGHKNITKKIKTVKKKITSLFLLMLCFGGIQSEIKACSPIKTSPQKMLEWYNSKDYFAVEGYYVSGQKFIVTRSSHTSIKIGKEYDVFEYGPFGSMCEEYELRSHLDPKFIGKEKTRILILFKGRSVNGKLVTDIFWNEGIDIDSSNNRVIAMDYDERYSTSLDKIKKRLFENETEPLEWEIKAMYNGMLIDELPEDYVFSSVEVYTSFPGGQEALEKYLLDNIKNPDIITEGPADIDVQGTIYISFTIERDGSIADIKLLRGIGFGFDEEAIRVVQMMPKWIPGKLRGKLVRVQHIMPIKIKT
jgi:hypothetical protein